MGQQKMKKILEGLEKLKEHFLKARKSAQYIRSNTRNSLRESMFRAAPVEPMSTAISILKNIVRMDTSGQEAAEEYSSSDLLPTKQKSVLLDNAEEYQRGAGSLKPTHKTSIDQLTISGIARSRSRNNFQDPQNLPDQTLSQTASHLEPDLGSHFSRARKRSRCVDEDIFAGEKTTDGSGSFKLSLIIPAKESKEEAPPSEAPPMSPRKPQQPSPKPIIESLCEGDSSSKGSNSQKPFNPFAFSRSKDTEEIKKWPTVENFSSLEPSNSSDLAVCKIDYRESSLRRNKDNLPKITVEPKLLRPEADTKTPSNDAASNYWAHVSDELQKKFKRFDYYLNKKKNQNFSSLSKAKVDSLIQGNKEEKLYHSDTEAENRRRTRMRYQEKQDNISVNEFDFIALLGQGGFGTVWLVKRRSTGDLYALKVIKFTNEDPAFIENLVNENQIMMSLVGDYVVKGIFSFVHKRSYCVVMELMVGGDFRKLLDEQSAFYEEDVKFYAAELALAVNHLHKQNITHRDLKPENMLLDNKGHLKLADFGLSNQVEEIDKHFASEGVAPAHPARHRRHRRLHRKKTQNHPDLRVATADTGPGSGK